MHEDEVYQNQKDHNQDRNHSKPPSLFPFTWVTTVNNPRIDYFPDHIDKNDTKDEWYEG